MPINDIFKNIENETHEIFKNFLIETDNQISAKRPNINKKKRTGHLVDLTAPADHRGKI